jgi:hypothetical protein
VTKRINFSSSGGYANLRLNYRADTDELPRDLAQELQGLVDSAGVFDFQPPPAFKGFLDAISYQLSVSEGGRSASLSVNDATAGPLLPLLTRLRQLAVEQRRSGG